MNNRRVKTNMRRHGLNSCMWLHLPIFILLCTERERMKMIKNEFLKETIPDRTVVLTFDDVLENHYTIAIPEMQARGFTGTLYASEVSFPAYGADNYADGLNKNIYMTWEQIAEASRRGFEIGNHSMNHRDLLAMTEEAVNAEISGIEQKCEEYGIRRPVTFAYPGLQYSETIIRILKDRGYCLARTGLADVYDPDAQSPYRVMSASIDGNDVDGFVRLVQKAKYGKIVVVMYHDTPNREVFAAMMEYLKQNDYHVMAMKDIARYVDVERAEKAFEQNPEKGM